MPFLRRWRLVIGVVLVAVFVPLAIAAHAAGPLPGDLVLIRAIQAGCTCASNADTHLVAALVAMPDVSQLVDVAAATPVGAVFAVPAAWALRTRRWNAAGLVAVSLAASIALEIVLKELIARPRPWAELVAIRTTAPSYAFPSGTGLQLAVFAGIVAELVNTGRPGGGAAFTRATARGAALRTVLLFAPVALVGVVGLGVVYLGAHWPTDVLGGWLLGGVTTLALTTAYRRIRPLGQPQATSPWTRRRT